MAKFESEARPTSTTRRAKPTTLPPPDEYAALVKAEADKKDGKNKKVLTTEERIIASKAAATARQVKRFSPPAKKTEAKKQETKKKADSEKTQRTGETEQVEKAKKTKVTGMLSQVDNHGASAMAFLVKKKKDLKSSVLYRRTRRSELYLRQNKDKVLADQPYAKPGNGRGLMDLPLEVRDMIWRLAVVDTQFFVWPDSPTGREQPDLAMVSTQVRQEVLPIFYGENVFAVDLSEVTVPRAKNGVKYSVRTGLGAIERWAAELVKSGSFSCIRRWAFDYMPSLELIRLHEAKRDDSFVVYLELRRPKNGRGSWCVQKLELHREARCILSRDPPCVVTQNPVWLNEAVYPFLETPGYPEIDSESLVRFALAIKSKVRELVAYQCEEVPAEAGGEDKSGL